MLFYLLRIGLIVVFLVLTLGSIVIGHLSLTYDEPQHFRYGEFIYHFNSNRFDDSKMPLSVINVIPAKFAERFFNEIFANEWQVMSIGRISTIFISLLLGGLCLLWTRLLYGKWVGLVSFGLYVIEPNIIAHSQLITTDIYAAATVTLTIFMFWRFMETPNPHNAILSGLALGLCQVAKYSGILMYPILFLLVVIRYGGCFINQFRRRSFGGIRSAILVSIKFGTLFLVTSVLIINLGFLFNRTGTAMGDYKFKSDFFQSIQQFSPALICLINF